MAIISSIGGQGSINSSRRHITRMGTTNGRRSQPSGDAGLVVFVGFGGYCWTRSTSGHDGGWLSQLDAQLLHDRPEVRQELIERLLALPDIEDLKLAIFSEA